MVQRLTMILWAKAKNENFNSTVEKAYKLMQLLKEFGSEISPNYECVNKKKDAKLFKWSYDEFEKLIKRGVNKEGKNVFIELGYSIGFFSSLVNKESAAIDLTIGVSNPMFINTFILDLPQTYNVFEDDVASKKLTVLFKKYVEIFEPFWGCIANSVNENRFDGYFKDDLPTSVHWLNYFGADIVQKIGIEKIENTSVFEYEKKRRWIFLEIRQVSNK